MSFLRRTHFPRGIAHSCNLSDSIKEGVHASDVPWVYNDVNGREKAIAIPTHFHAFRGHVSSTECGTIPEARLDVQ